MLNYKPVKYVIFDMDGLLLDTEKLYFQTFEKILRKYGKIYTHDISLKVTGMIPKDIYKTFINYYNLPVSLEKITEEISAELVVAMEKSELMPGAEQLILHLKKNNIPIALATSSGNESFDIKIKKHKTLFNLFHHIVIGSSDSEVKSGKPSPDIFLVCASRFSDNPPPNECLVFEDSPNGVMAAISAGMQVVMVPDPTVPENKKTLATKVIPSLLVFKPEEFGLPKY